MIIRSRVVVTMNGPPIENGAVAISGNQIADAGLWEEVKARNSGEALDLGECALLPGLINAHCHLDYTILRGAIPAPGSFAGWVRVINQRKAALSAEDYLSSIARGLREAQEFGTTTLVNLEAFPELLPRMRRPPLRTWWMPELIDVRGEVSVPAVLREMRAGFENRDGWLGGVGLAPHAPYTASAKLYAEAFEVARRNDLLFTTHLAEAQEEMAMFRDGNGPLFDFMRSIGRPMEDCGRQTPLALLLGAQVIDERAMVAHLNELTTEDMLLLARAPRFHIVHCPRSHAYFGHAPFALKELRGLGFNVCLGTDSLASNETLSLFAEMRELQRKEPELAARELIEMATVNAARALRQSHFLGRISPGFGADLIAIPFESAMHEIFEAAVAFDRTPAWMMVNGSRVSPRSGDASSPEV